MTENYNADNKLAVLLDSISESASDFGDCVIGVTVLKAKKKLFSKKFISINHCVEVCVDDQTSDLEILIDEGSISDLVDKKLLFPIAYMQGKLKLEGNMSLGFSLLRSWV